MNWPALESDPEIFTNYFRGIGLNNRWEFQEVFTLDDEVDGAAVVLAYKFTDRGSVFEGAPAHGGIFIKQTAILDNACGLIAALHAILSSNADVEEGSLLADIRQRIQGQSPEEAAEIVIHNQALKDKHHEYASQGQSEVTDCPNYHYVVVVPGFILYDGLQESPITLPCEGSLSTGFFTLVKQYLEAGKLSEDMSMMVLKRVE